MDVYERANIRPTRKEQGTQNQTKMCAIIVFDVCFELYAEPLFGNVGLNGSLNQKINSLNPSNAIRSYKKVGYLATSGAGWYRFAEIICLSDVIAKGSECQYIEAVVRQTFNNSLGCFYKVSLYLIYDDRAKMTVVGQGTNVLKKFAR